MLLPLSVSTPAPFLVSPPPAPLMTPLKEVVVPSLPTVKALAPPRVTLPVPASEPIVFVRPAVLSMPGEFTVTALLALRTFAVPAVRVPELMVVGPV